ncbi:MAG: terminase family protein [Puniceicoccales bacterium]|jgi:phage FluMu gp28-like protein|nr:terminase family protein [Puniceicoccales bacterium]
MDISKKFFLPYQSRWINDDSRLKIMEKSRQIGISMASAYGLVRDHANCDQRIDSWVSSRDEIQAKLFLDDCKNFSKILHIAAQAIGSEILPESRQFASFSLRFLNSTHIHSLSSNPDAQAGKRGNRVLDEFALHQNPKTLYSVAYPGITWGGRLEIISTHRGSQNFFHRLLKDIKENGNPKKFSHHKVTLQDALDQGFLAKLKEKLPEDDSRQSMDEAEYFDHIRNSCPDEESFMQEYMCVPWDDQSIFLPTELIDKCTYKHGENWEIGNYEALQSNDGFLGIDIGRNHDLTVFWLLEKNGDCLKTRQVICLKDVPFSEQERLLHEFLKIPFLRKICIDQTGIGRQFAERAAAFFGKYKVEGITFTSYIKEALAYLLLTTFETGSIKIPNDPAIRSDLRAIKKEITFSGNIRFHADRSENGHADRFWALALAIHAAQQCPSMIKQQFFTKIQRHKRLTVV